MEADLLKKLCRSLDGQRKKSHQEAVEWQHFGRFTASVLQKEVEGFERKLRVLQERLDGLVRENGELRDMCLYLDKSRKKSGTGGGGGREARTGRGQFDGVPVHSMCVEEMNRDDTEPALQYSGITSEDTLRDKKVKQFNVLGTKDPQTAATMLQKRVEKLESERLELIKSLSAAHLLATHSQQVTPLTASTTSPVPPPPSSVKEPVLPPEFQTLLESCKGIGDHTSLRATTSRQGLNVSADMIMQAITLLDMCRRMDAMEANGFTDPLEEAEVATLRVLMSIAWQRLQEEQKQ